MSAATIVTSEQTKPHVPEPAPVVALNRRTIDTVLIGFGVVAALAFAVAGALLTWGNSFSADYVTKELSSQHVSFPDAAGLKAEGRNDLVQWAGHRVDTGREAQAYAGYINGHLAKVAAGATYADLSAPQTAAKAAVAAAVTANAPQGTVDALTAKVTAITAQRTTLFTGETLRGAPLHDLGVDHADQVRGLEILGLERRGELLAQLSFEGHADPSTTSSQ